MTKKDEKTEQSKALGVSKNLCFFRKYPLEQRVFTPAVVTWFSARSRDARRGVFGHFCNIEIKSGLYGLGWALIGFDSGPLLLIELNYGPCELKMPIFIM